MSFPALDFKERQKKQELSELYEVRGIPCLVILDQHGNLITKDGRALISQGTPFDEWNPKEKEAAAAGKD
jgi:hypothetical protein